MLNRLLLIVVILLFASGATSAQAGEPARLRLMQLSFVDQGSTVINVHVDANVVFEEVSFPFSTPYIELSSGDHTLTTTIAEVNDATASAALTLEAGHSYTLVVEGDYSADTVHFVLVDEADLPPVETGSTAVAVNLTAQPLDLAIDGETVLESVAAGTYEAFSVPEAEFVLALTPANLPDDVIYREAFNPLADITLVTIRAIAGQNEVQVIPNHSSRLTIAEYLLSQEAAEPFADVIRRATDLASAQAAGGTYTLFLPTADALAALGDTIATDPDKIAMWLTNHITLTDIPPYDLMGTETLTMLSGNVVSLSFADTHSGYWEIKGAPIFSDIRLANGVIYVIDGIMLP